MFKKPFFWILSVMVFMFIFLEYAISSTNKYSYDFAEPVTVVEAASKMIMACDYEEMLAITEMNEKKRTQDTVESIKSDPKVLKTLTTESEKLLGFQVLNMEVFTNDVTNQMVIVTSKWTIKIPAGSQAGNPNNYVKPGNTRKAKTESEVFVDYLLKKFEDKWKIISTKTRQ